MAVITVEINQRFLFFVEKIPLCVVDMVIEGNDAVFGDGHRESLGIK
jgi:hypothetical protein